MDHSSLLLTRQPSLNMSLPIQSSSILRIEAPCTKKQNKWQFSWRNDIRMRILCAYCKHGQNMQPVKLEEMMFIVSHSSNSYMSSMFAVLAESLQWRAEHPAGPGWSWAVLDQNPPRPTSQRVYPTSQRPHLAVGDGVEHWCDFCRSWNVDNNGVRRGQSVVHHDGKNVVDDHDVSLWRTDTLQVMLGVRITWLCTAACGFDQIFKRFNGFLPCPTPSQLPPHQRTRRSWQSPRSATGHPTSPWSQCCQTTAEIISTRASNVRLKSLEKILVG